MSALLAFVAVLVVSGGLGKHQLLPSLVRFFQRLQHGSRPLAAERHHDVTAARDHELARLGLAIVEGVGLKPAPGIRLSAAACHPLDLRHQISALVCQTVLVSVKNVTRSTEGAGTPGSGVSTRFRVSAALICRSTQSVSPAPARSMALTSACAASHGASSAAEPVRTLTTPPGTSLVAITSLRLIALSGDFSLATTTTVLPLTRAGATTLTNPSSEDCCGAMTATTPVASGVEMLKYGPLTGLPFPAT